MIKISVIIPVYNAENFLAYTLDSVLSQSLEDIEIICVNDGSTDGSLRILNEYAKEDKRVVVRTQENFGSGAARNLALRIAKGEFIAFMDADDWYPSADVLGCLYDAVKKYNQKMAGGSFVRYYEDGRIEEQFFGVYQNYTFEKEELVFAHDYQFDYGYHRFIYDRHTILENGIFFPDYRRFQDPPFFLRALIASNSFVSVNKKVYAYRKGHQIVSWDVKKVVGLLSGLLENLLISQKFQMLELHCIIIDRLEKDFFKVIKENSDNFIVQYLLSRIFLNIDLMYLSKRNYRKLSELKISRLLRHL